METPRASAHNSTSVVLAAGVSQRVLSPNGKRVGLYVSCSASQVSVDFGVDVTALGSGFTVGSSGPALYLSRDTIGDRITEAVFAIATGNVTAGFTEVYSE